MDPDGIPHSQQSAIKFTSCNPLSVHTKTKSVAGITFLEVSLGESTFPLRPKFVMHGDHDTSCNVLHLLLCGSDILAHGYLT